MKSSTATFLAYNLRPAKQTERRLLLDFLICASGGAAGLASHRYVGMGGTMFYDFHLVHRFLGIKEMVSLERDAAIFPRCEFNRPFDFITAVNQTTAQFFASDKSKKRTVYWLDYDDGISSDIVADVLALGTKVKEGGAAFVTVCSQAPGVLNKESAEARLEYFVEHFTQFVLGLTATDFENQNFPKTIEKILTNAFVNAFSARTDGKLIPVFRVAYRDTMTMLTVGGYFCSNADEKVTRTRIRTSLPFLFEAGAYEIKNLNLTDRERSVFDMAVTKKRSNSKHANLLRALGFSKTQFDAYRQLVRFLPRYHESIV